MDEANWPKLHKVNLSGNRERNRMIGEYLGLDEVATRKLRDSLQNVVAYIRIAKNGSVGIDTITSGDHVFVKPAALSTDTDPVSLDKYEEFHG